MEPKELNRFMDQLYEIVKTQSASCAVESLFEKLGHANNVAGTMALCQLLVLEHARAKHAIAKFQYYHTRMNMAVGEINEEILKEGKIF